jgi:dihydrodipicolinate synthase/N-acetylneuraminate lyase
MVTPMAYVVELIDTFGGGMKVYTSVRDLVSGLVLGADGCLAAEPNVIPNMCMRVLGAFDGSLDQDGHEGARASRERRAHPRTLRVAAERRN